MNRLFVRILLGFLIALLVLLGGLVAVFLWGYERSLAEWSLAKRNEIEKLARSVLTGKQNREELQVPDDVPLFIYDASQELLFSNRGQGSRRLRSGEIDLIPLEQQGRIIGYYHSGSLTFRNDLANQRFIASMGRFIWAGIPISLAVSFLFALLFSRGLASPAIEVARGLDRITHGELTTIIPEKGATEIALIARSANRLGSQLKREQAMRRQWAEDIAHDLRTPVSALKAQFEAMRDGLLAATAERIEKNLLEFSRIETLISDLEELTRLESPDMTIVPEEIPAGSFMEELQDRFSLQIAKKRINFSFKTEVERLQGDRALLLRALSNLLSNAIRHTFISGSIEIALESQDRHFLIRVANSGKTIPAEELDKVFDRLFRGEYARQTPGSGLGLTITKKIAELHGGSVRIRNQQDLGVVVELTIGKSA